MQVKDVIKTIRNHKGKVLVNTILVQGADPEPVEAKKGDLIHALQQKEKDAEGPLVIEDGNDLILDFPV